ncbi:unnamed protein product [Phaedon cochleariae]|uniref:UDP-glucuronosyltransferase n=1 Tax=Phaedon cochleariae TaxID=80249 RepID=A0A9P0GTP2_PHACE|nr:unnamed protein product [Phaedon cochleariae]
MRFRLPTILSLVFLTNTICAYRILGIFPISSKSHYNLGGALMRALAEAGHDVTVVTVFPDNETPKNGTWREIYLKELYVKQQELLKNQISPTEMPKSDISKMLFMSYFFNSLGVTITEELLADPKMQELIRSGDEFDVVIVPQFLIEAVKALSNHFNAHLVLLNNHAANSWMNHLVGNPTIPSFFPEVVLAYPEDMSFFQRVKNTVCKYIQLLSYHLVVYPRHSKLVSQYISEDIDFYDALYNVSLVLSNSHESLSNPQPSVPCMKDIGGFHIKPPKKLPVDLQKYLDDAKEGAILYSLGSNVRSVDLPVSTREALLKAFAKRKENILMKWEDDVLPGKPENVRISKWLPQSDILAHPNVKLFITHGGFLSTSETVYHGVPIIAIPIFGDQLLNARLAENGGFAVVLDITDLTEENLSAALEKMISDPKYTENVKERSQIFHDRIHSPLEEAIYWIEYVVRHNGAKHLRVPYPQMPWYKYILLDVFLFFACILALSYIVLRFICKHTVGRLFRKEKIKVQ